MAAVNTQFSIAVHLLASLSNKCDKESTSVGLAESVNACPSFVRRILSKLSKANLIHATTGKGGCCSLTRNPEDIDLLEIYMAVDAPKVFAIHDYPKQKACPISCNIKSSMGEVLEQTQHSMESSLKKISLADIIHQMLSK
jgi:Rrf2 family protein